MRQGCANWHNIFVCHWKRIDLGSFPKRLQCAYSFSEFTRGFSHAGSVTLSRYAVHGQAFCVITN